MAVSCAAVHEYFDWIERTGLSVWIREDSVWAFPNILILHTIGLAFLVGANVALNARIFGVARGVPLAAAHTVGVQQLSEYDPVSGAALQW